MLMGNNGMMPAPMPRMTPPKPIVAPRTQYLPGRFISNESDITPGEIPMDGSISFFCTNDLGRIIIKQWNAQGTLDTMTYTLDRPQPQVDMSQQQAAQPQMPDTTAQQPQQAPQQPDPTVAIKALTDSIENAFNNLAANINQGMAALGEKIDNMESGRG